MKKIKSLQPSVLSSHKSPASLGYKTTSEVIQFIDFIGQTRAIDAIQFGIHIKKKGFNIYVLGSTGIGRHAITYNILEQEAKSQNTSQDWCYVHNFEKPQQPIALALKPGVGNRLKEDINALLNELIASLPNAFEKYHNRIKKLRGESSAQLKLKLKIIKEEAKTHSLRIFNKPEGFIIKPVKNGKLMKNKDFLKLSKELKTKIKKNIKNLSQKLEKYYKRSNEFHSLHHQREKEIKNEIAMSASWYNFDQLKKKYNEYPKVVNYINSFQSDLIRNVDDFLTKEDKTTDQPPLDKKNSKFSRYQVNLFIDNSQTIGAPIIYEENPIYKNLFGYVTQNPSANVDAMLVRSGSIHKANGGYLIIDIHRILKHPSTWQALKRALHSEKIIIEDLESTTDSNHPNMLEPEPIPLEIKVIILGGADDYHELYDEDPDFKELFKVLAECEQTIERNPANVKLYAELIATLIHKKNLKPFNRDAVARIIDHAARIASDKLKLSIHLRSLNDILDESDYWATLAGRNIVSKYDVQKTIDSQIYRLDKIREAYFEDILRNIISIQTKGKIIGQINGLLVVTQGNFSFGHPARITATTRFGKGKFIDIQRKIELGGPIHTKGVLVLEGFLRGRYKIGEPLSLFVSIVFEQIYSFVDGDSASVGEACAILSSLAKVPIHQEFAITGSMNQFGEVQTIGSVNEKIEGFFDICKAKGLTGKQGVLIPKPNIQHLILRDDVVVAVADKKFHIYAIETIDEAMSLLTELNAGVRDKNGNYPKNSINGRIEAVLAAYGKKKIFK